MVERWLNGSMKGGLVAEELDLAQDIGSFSLDPVGFVKYVFPWESENFKSTGPRRWQMETLEVTVTHLQNNLIGFSAAADSCCIGPLDRKKRTNQHDYGVGHEHLRGL